ARVDDVDRFPYPIIVAVDINAQKVDLAGEAALPDQRVDVLGGDEALLKRELAVGDERREVAPDRGGARGIAFDPQAAPALDQKLCAVALDAGLNPELHEGAARRADAAEDFGDDAVLVVLGINLVAV